MRQCWWSGVRDSIIKIHYICIMAAAKNIKLSKFKQNPSNPRIIKDDKFHKLVKSIESFPQMMEKRPLVCVTDTDGKIYPIGGNMRLKAIRESGMTEIPYNWVQMADDWTQEQIKEFIIKDNVGFGEWDWEELGNSWDEDQLQDWGLNIPNWSAGVDENYMDENDIDIDEEFDPIGVSSGLQRVVFVFDGSLEAESYLNSIQIKEYSKKGQAWQVNMSTRSI